MPIELGSFSLGSVAGSIVGAIAAHYLTKSRNTEDRKIKDFNQAATAFRSRVLVELKGLYPVTQHWDMATYQRFYQSIPEIESAAEAFRFFVTRKGTFDTAIKEYCDYCKQISPEQGKRLTYATMSDQGEITPRQKFDHLVKNLLSFEEEK